MSRQPTQLEQAIAVTRALTEETRKARETLKDLLAVEKRMKEQIAFVNAAIAKLPQDIEAGIARLIEQSNNDLLEKYQAGMVEAESAALEVVKGRFEQVDMVLSEIRKDAMLIHAMMPPSLGMMNHMTVGALSQVVQRMSAFGTIVRSDD